MHLGRLLNQAHQIFEARVLQRMAAHERLPLRWAHRIESARITAALVHITRHLGPEGARLSELAARAPMSKQAMASVVDECEVLGLVQRTPDAADARAKRVQFTETGLLWLEVYEGAVRQTQQEFQDEVGQDVATVVALGLEAYAGGQMAALEPKSIQRRGPKI